MTVRTKLCTALAGIAAAAAATPAFAQAADYVGQPTDWQIWHTDAATPIMGAIVDFDWLTLYVLVPIVLFVTALLGYVMWKYRASAHPVPEKTTHNTAIEVVWTLGPIAVLVFLAIPSFQLLSSEFNPPEPPALTVKATGYQWYWNYEYQDTSAPVVEGTETAAEPEQSADAAPAESFAFDSRPIGAEKIAGSAEKALAERVAYGKEDLTLYPRLLAVDNEMIVPVGKVIRVLVTAGDVIHNFAMPSFGLKMDGYPGRLNETFFQPTREGLFYGQCSELCGAFHSYMPIGIRVVSEEQYAAWRAAAPGDIDAANKALIAQVSAEAESEDATVEVAQTKVIEGN